MVKPLDVERPAVDMAPVNVEVPAPVTAKLVVVALVVVERVTVNPEAYISVAEIFPVEER